MAITLGTVLLDETHTAVHEKHAETGGRDGRSIVLSGLVLGEETIAAVEARLDAILAAASDVSYGTALSLRPGRRMWVRRTAFSRDINRSRGAGSFELHLQSGDPCEESIEPTVLPWPITSSGDTLAVPSMGNTTAPLRVTLTASGPLVFPGISDGLRTLLYEGVVAPSQVVVLDGAEGRLTLDGEDVTPYSSGDFPRLNPGENLLTYVDAPTSSHAAAAELRFRDRWW